MDTSLQSPSLYKRVCEDQRARCRVQRLHAAPSPLAPDWWLTQTTHHLQRHCTNPVRVKHRLSKNPLQHLMMFSHISTQKKKKKKDQGCNISVKQDLSFPWHLLAFLTEVKKCCVYSGLGTRTFHQKHVPPGARLQTPGDREHPGLVGGKVWEALHTQAFEMYFFFPLLTERGVKRTYLFVKTAATSRKALKTSSWSSWSPLDFPLRC